MNVHECFMNDYFVLHCISHWQMVDSKFLIVHVGKN